METFHAERRLLLVYQALAEIEMTPDTLMCLIILSVSFVLSVADYVSAWRAERVMNKSGGSWIGITEKGRKQ